MNTAPQTGKLAILHYHLKIGGVTQVIRMQIDALRRTGNAWSLTLLAGREPDEPFDRDISLQIHPELDYLPAGLTAAEYRARGRAIKAILHAAVDTGTLVHAHNLNLGKNPLVTLAVSDLAAAGRPVFNHCHDFAEDRPANLTLLTDVITTACGRDLTEVMYPSRAAYRFGVLNTPDRDRLTARSVAADRIDLLPNPVTPPPAADTDRPTSRAIVSRALDIDPGRAIMVYPVRAIRRKNIGEFILFSLLFRERAAWIITRAPRNPAELELYQAWQTLADETGAAIRFEAADTVDYSHIMNAADRVVTTSTREGFGMAFLEPWLCGLPVTGRDIPGVTGDFKAAGIRLPLLYDRLPVRGSGTETDFADLAPEAQMDFIRRMSDPVQSARFVAETGLEQTLFSPIPDTMISTNADMIRNSYSVKAYGKHLDSIYRRMSGGPEAA